MHNVLMRKLESFIRLSDADEIRLANAFRPSRRFAARTDIVPEGDDPSAAHVILDGWACRYKQFTDGRRQIISLLLPGDICDPHVFLLSRIGHAIGALTPVTVSRITGETIRDLKFSSPTLQEAFDREALATVEIQREWTVSLGRRSATERLAHLFCELHLRLAAVGLADASSCPLPLTQTDLADVLGLTSVHINRTLRDLRNTGLITLSGKRLVIEDAQGLRQLAHFDPTYLQVASGETDPLGPLHH